MRLSEDRRLQQVPPASKSAARSPTVYDAANRPHVESAPLNVAVIIPAAGRSSRFGESDKLAQDLGGRAMLIRTVEIFAKLDAVKSIIVAGPPDSFTEFRERYAPTLSFHGAMVVEGGRAERWETVRNALEAVPEDATHIAVHDAARPAATHELIRRVFDAASKYDAVIPAVSLTATLKRVEEEARVEAVEEDDAIADIILGDVGKAEIAARRVLETMDRKGLVEVQTPQMFKADLLRRAYAAVDPDGVTDDASVVERFGQTVYVVEGDPRNIKVTTPADLSLMRAILNVKPPAERPVHKRF